MKIHYIFIILSISITHEQQYCSTLKAKHVLNKEFASNAKKGNFDLLKEHIAKGANLNYKDHDEKTVLIYAVGYRRADVIKFLSAQKLDPNIMDDQNMTALMLAASIAAPELVKELISFKDLKINKQGKFGKTALDWAYLPKHFYAEQFKYINNQLSENQKKVIEILRRHGAKTANELTT